MPLGLAILNDPLALFLSGLALLILFFWYFATDIDRRKRNVGSILVIGVTALCALAVWPPQDTIKGGIDIVGGSAFTLRVQPNLDENGNPVPVSPDAANQAIQTIEKRLNVLGTKDLFIQRQGNDRIRVQMPGIEPEQAAEVRTILERAAKLELKKVNLDGFNPGTDSRTLAERVDSGDEIVPGFKAYKRKYEDDEGNERSELLLLSRRTALDGSNVRNAQPNSFDPTQVDITLDGDGEDKMIALTKDMTKNRDRIAIVLDGEVMSAPVVQATPLGRQFVITGMADYEESRSLSNALLNPLKNELLVEEERTVSPTLGHAVVQQGIWAGIVGLAITFIFVLIYYRLAGLIALTALSLNILLLFGAMAMFGFTLTLPGIAGIILTIGMAVDANVLIYERLREEMATGKSLRAAVEAAYDKAFSAIFDANITSLLTALVLFWRASGTVKGFAVTLTVGLLASMFAALLITRVLFRWGNDTKILGERLSFLNLIPSHLSIDFLGKRKIAAMVSLVLIATALGGFGLKQSEGFGIDFTGGTLISFQLGDKKISEQEIKDSYADLKLNKLPFVQEEVSPATGELITIRCASEDTNAIVDELRKDIPLLGERIPLPDNPEKTGWAVQDNREEVSAALGKEFLEVSLVALAIGLLAILLYITIRYEFSFAIGAFCAVVHDVVITTGLVVLMGGELSLIHVGAILTIAGYSINDTIVVFDRIRENLKTKRGGVEEVMNGAINATLSRTVLTSATTIITVLVLWIFGGAALKDFSGMILVGLVVGTYSSIFVASPIVLWWSKLRGTNLRRELLDANLEAKINPAA